MHKLISGLFVISLLLSVASCNRNAVKLSETNANGEVSQLGNLYFRFNRSLYPDSLLNRWDSSEFVRFTPKITGRFRWQSPDELVFSPSQPLPPATNFSAEISSEVFRYTEFSGVENKKKLMFHTPNVKLEEVNVTWVILDQQISKAVPQIDMYFNNKVDPADLKELLSVVREEEKLPFTIQTQSADNKISVVLPETSFEDKDYAAKVIVAKGFKPVGGVNKTDKDDELKFIIPSPYTLTINNVVSSHNGLEGTVYVRTSQQVSGNIKEYLSIDPEISFQVEAVDDGFMVRSASFNADKAYEIKMKQGLKGKIGGTLKETHYEQVSFGELEPELQFTNSNAVYLGKEGARNIEIKLVNVAKVKLIVSKIYESNILMAGRYGYYPRESDPEYDYYGYENNYGTLGDVIYEKEISVAELPQYGNSRLLHFNFADKVPDFKGVYHIVIRSTEDYWISDSRLVSLSDIGLIAKEGEDRLFVFANSIKTTTSLKDVNITVYGNNNQVLGIGSTNADGVAEITYIKRDARGFKPAMVVATNGDDFNYLPFNSTRVNTSRFEVGGKRTNLSGLDAFVYSERDIYRPGEKIHFALILRDAEWKSPGEIPVKFRMLMPNGKELKAFRKNLDAQGSAEGSVEISSFGITGTYTLEVYTSNDVLLASRPFMVEEFVPDRIRVNTS
ncbi:MAG TPA: MG2 domain-containing protein, partial [Parasegetibacter sp.]